MVFLHLLSFASQDVMPWKLDVLYSIPKVYDASAYATNDVKALFFEGVPFKGRPTRVFAYYGIPEGASKDKPVPAMVLVHGGGGSAFHRWVKMWVDRGYAAISMDTCGAISGNGYNNHKRHAFSGPKGWGGFQNIDEPISDQWTYHAVAAVVRAHSLLRSWEGVDAERTGITGISWGGYLTCISASIDNRFKFAVPVYGCGFLGNNSAWKGTFDSMGERGLKWLRLWDPSVYLSRAEIPFMWVAGTNDFAYPMDSLQMSYELVAPPVTLCLRPRMIHGQWQGAEPAEIFVYADHFLKGGPALPEIKSVERDNLDVKVKYDAHGRKIAKAVFNYTCGKGSWKEREWKELPAVIIPGQDRIEARVPDCRPTWYINLITDDGLVVSTPHDDMK